MDEVQGASAKVLTPDRRLGQMMSGSGLEEELVTAYNNMLDREKNLECIMFAEIMLQIKDLQYSVLLHLSFSLQVFK